ncbi:MAG: hypothetical protein NTY09_12445 [bacterium]|nr:hypothetical protein [bacterium]
MPDRKRKSNGCLIWVGLFIALFIILYIKEMWDEGKIPWYIPIKVERISAPTVIEENLATTLILQHTGGYTRSHPHSREDGSIVFEWSCTPPDAGSFSRNSSSTIFTPNDVPSDTEVAVRCTVTPPDGVVVDREVTITIKDTPEEGDWARALGSSFQCFVKSVDLEIDNDGYAYLAGMYSGVLTMNGRPDPSRYYYYGEHRGFIAKYSPTGDLVKFIDWGSQPNDEFWVHQVFDIALDSSGNIYATGSFEGNVDLDPGSGVDIHTSEASSAFLIKLDSDGNFEWAKVWGGSNHWPNSDENACNCIRVTDSGGIFLAGECYGEIEMSQSEPSGIKCRGDQYAKSVYLLNFDFGGNLRWLLSRPTDGCSSLMVDPEDQLLKNMVIDQSDNIYWFYGQQEYILEKVDKSGNSVLSHQFESRAPDCIALDSLNNIYLSGSFNDAGTWMRISPEDVQVSNRYGWYQLICFDSDFNFQWLYGDTEFPSRIREILPVDGNKLLLFREYSGRSNVAPEYWDITAEQLAITICDAMGNPISENTWEGSNSGTAVCLAFDSMGNLYISGNRHMFQEDAYDTFLMRITTHLVGPE